MKTEARNGRQPLVSVIIPVLNKCELTLQCLASIANLQTEASYEVIVVDNASTDDTPAQIAQRHPRAVLLRNSVNGGFARACNQGATTAKGKYLLLLNNDTIPLAGWMDELVREVQSQPKVAAVGSKLIYASGLVQHAGVVFGRASRSPYHPYRMLRADDPRVNRRKELSAVTAACILIRQNWFQDCGGLSEVYRNGYEDLDLCLRIRSRGGVIVYQPRSTLVHLESQTPGRFGHDAENRAKFFERWSDALLSDEDAFYLQDNYRVLNARPKFPEVPQLVRVGNNDEREQWAMVARVQSLAAEAKHEECVALLQNTLAWPTDHHVRRWAGIVCQKWGMPGEAREHFRAAIAAQRDAELELYLGEPDQSVSQSVAALYHQARRAADDGNHTLAQALLEKALLQGGPLKLILPALAQCSRATGSRINGDAMQKAAANLGCSEGPAMPPKTGTRATVVFAPVTQQTGPGSASANGATKCTSIIILVRDQLDHTKACLESIERDTPEPHEVVLVDNGSSATTAEWLASYTKQHEGVLLIRNESNLGFAAGNNQGLSICRGETIILLNNDTVVTAGWLTPMLEELKQNTSVGIVGPRSNRVAGVQAVQNAAYSNLEELHRFARAWSQQNAGQYQETGRVIGFCMLMRRSVFEAIGGLDARYGSGNFEDDDYCIRAGLAGFKVMVAHASFVHHEGGQTFRGCGINYHESMLRNWDLFKRKWHLPAGAVMENGYSIPQTLPNGTALKEPVSALATTHETQFHGRVWQEKKRSSKAALVVVPMPPCVKLGGLDNPLLSIKNGQHKEAWQATVSAIVERPHHPGAYLLLAEIAFTAGDSIMARACAQHARGLAPDWKPARKFLARGLHGRNHPEWAVMPESLQRDGNKPPTLTVCLITRNEERFIIQCLDSVRTLAKQIVVIDTGSTDRTKELALSRGAEVHDFTWCDDFSAARNEALRHARGEWVLMLDADEELLETSRQALLQMVANKKAILWRLPIVDKGREEEGCNYVPRLFRNAPGLFYSGRIHEQVFSSIEARRAEWGMENKLGDATLLHHGYSAELLKDRNKVARNLRLLELALQETPNNSNLVMNYGLELVRSGKVQEGLEQYRAAYRLMAKAPVEQAVPEARETLLNQFTAQLMANGCFEELVSVLESPMARAGGLSAGSHFTLGLALMKLARHAQAAEQMRQCIAKRGAPSITPRNKDISKAAPSHCLALCLTNLGRAEEAAEAFQKALAEDPASAAIQLDYAKFLVLQKRPVDALQVLHGLVQAEPRDSAAWLLGSQICLSHPDFLEVACDWTEEAIAALPNDPALAGKRLEALLVTSQIAKAAELLSCGTEPLAASERAAWVLTSLIANKAAPEIAPAAEPQISVEFIKWYQRLVKFGAAENVMLINNRLGELCQILPTAGRMLRSAVQEADARM